MHPIKTILVLVLAAVLFSGCAQTNSNIYHWGEYENIIYKSYAKPGELSIQEQIQLLNTDIIKAQEANKKIPPGFYAHLGYLYLADGDYRAAMTSLENEQSLYPESAPFLTGMINRMNQENAR